MTRELLAALAYASHGWAVFPAAPDKRPLTMHGFHSATTAPETIREWWARWPDAGVAWAIRPGLLVVDVDCRHDGFASLAALQAERGALPSTLTSLTGGGGLHMVYRLPARVQAGDVRQLTGLRPGVDTRVGGLGYIVLPPSKHASGERYQWQTRDRPAEAPDWLVELLRVPAAPAPTSYTAPPAPTDLSRRCRYAWRALEGECEAVAGTAEGGRNHRLCAAWLRCTRDLGDVLPREAVREQLTRAALAAGLPEPEIRRVLRDELAMRGAA